MTGSVGVLVAFSAGLFSFLSPCVLPLFPSYVSFITGMSVSDLTTDLSGAARRRVLLHSVAFVGGFSLVFVALGASFSAAGQFLLDYRNLIRQIGGALIVLFGLYIAGVFKLAAMGRTMQFQLREKPAGYLGSLVVGFTFAIGWTPCVGPILGAILSLAGTTEIYTRTYTLSLHDALPISPFVERHGLTFLVGLDPKMELANTYGVRALPSSFVINRDGLVTAVAIGPRVWDNEIGRAHV